MQVLVADDDEVQRDILTSMLESHGHEVTAVCDGEEAWKMLEQKPISLIFTDWMMPGLNGLDLIRKIRSSQLERYVYIILCTGRSSQADLVEGMRSGSDDYLAKPFQEDELIVRMASGERVIQLEVRLEEDNRKLEAANQNLSLAYDTIRQDLEAAARLQHNLLPAPARIRGVRFESLFCPASMVAGDIFNYFSLNENSIGFYLLDVSGHGIPAAMLSVTLSKMLSSSPLSSSPLKRPRPIAPWHEVVPPHQAVADLNQRFQDNGGMYFTMVYGVLGVPCPGRLTLVQAGHPDPIYLPREGPPLALGKGGFPVGVLPHMDYESCEQQMSRGDRVFVTSDGVLECMNPQDEQFGPARLMEFIEIHRENDLKTQLDALQETLKEWTQGEEFKDDVSMLAFELT